MSTDQPTPAQQAARHLQSLPGYSSATLTEPQWLADLIARHRQVLASGEGHRCEHAGLVAYQPLHMAVWAPGTVVCTPCAKAGVMTASTEVGEEERCDRCRCVSPNLVIHSVPYLDQMVWFALCPTCRGRTLTAGPATGDHVPCSWPTGTGSGQ